MNVLHILDERWDSGVTAYGLGAAQALRRRGHAVWVAARPGFAAARQAAERGLAVVPLGSPWSLRRWTGAHAVDVVNAHTGSGHSTGFFITRLRTTALVRTRGEARRMAVRPGQSFLFRHTDAVVAASSSLADSYLGRFPFLRSRLSVVYPGVDVPPFVPPPVGPVRAGIVGRLDPVKGHDVLLEALGLLKDRLSGERFLVAGEEKNTPRDALERRARELGVSSWVQFLGRVPDAGALMSGCHFGIVCSVESEAVSRAGMEWLSRGRPLVASRVGALPEMVTDGENGLLVPPRDPRALARAVRVLLDEPDRRARMGEAARRRAGDHFSLDRWGARTEEVYLSALSRRRKVP